MATVDDGGRNRRRSGGRKRAMSASAPEARTPTPAGAPAFNNPYSPERRVRSERFRGCYRAAAADQSRRAGLPGAPVRRRSAPSSECGHSVRRLLPTTRFGGGGVMAS